jgi:hypothetical protein
VPTIPTSATTNTIEKARLKLDISGNPIEISAIELCENYRFLAVAARGLCWISKTAPDKA